MRQVRASFAALAVAAVAALAIGGCGGDDEEEGAAPEGPPDQTVRVSETEFELDPANPTVKPGIVAFKVSNDGKVEHNLEVEGPEGEAEFEEDLAPGESSALTVDLSEPGTYTWYCPVDDHKQRGMEGEITVGSGKDGEGSDETSGSGAPTDDSGY